MGYCRPRPPSHRGMSLMCLGLARAYVRAHTHHSSSWPPSSLESPLNPSCHKPCSQSLVQWAPCSLSIAFFLFYSSLGSLQAQSPSIPSITPTIKASAKRRLSPQRTGELLCQGLVTADMGLLSVGARMLLSLALSLSNHISQECPMSCPGTIHPPPLPSSGLLLLLLLVPRIQGNN